jgi:hypothetical protein
MLEDSTREIEQAEQEKQEMRGKTARARNELADLLSEAISSLDERRPKEQKQ